MSNDPLRGAVIPTRPDATPDSFDLAHGVMAKDLFWRLAREAYGADYPEQLQPWGMTTWWTLGRFVGGLRLAPGHRRPGDGR